MPDAKKPLRSRAKRNRTLEISDAEEGTMRTRIADGSEPGSHAVNSIIHGDAFSVLKALPEKTFDLLFADPPYNLTKRFGVESFKRSSADEYEHWLDSWLALCAPLLKETGTVYICGDWRSGAVIERAGSRYFNCRNRITWEREKGRGAANNWKNAAEDIWFFTVSNDYFFDVEAVKIRRNVLAPYTQNGKPKDWTSTREGNIRLTHPSNIWTDITVPFWSMPENTDHPTQKPEKLLAKMILASTKPGDLILDPFAGSGTTGVTAKKLGRNFVMIESDENYCMLAAKRLELAESDRSIQGFADGVFWERNSGK